MMKFVGMKSITKQLQERWTNSACSDWVATEKVHGSSYQFSTKDGQVVQSGSRRYPLKDEGSFLRCGTKKFRERYEPCVKEVYRQIVTDDKWAAYRKAPTKATNCDNSDGEEEEDNTKAEEDHHPTSEANNEKGEDRLKPEVHENTGQEDDGVKGGVCKKFGESEADKSKADKSEADKSEADKPESVKRDGGETNEDIDQRREEEEEEVVELRIYGELYGGGGVEKEVRPAVQKEIIYSDEFRFYVFGMTVNRNWLSVAEMNELCELSGFPFYAIPVCEPKASLEELKDWLVQSGFMMSRSRLTDRTDDNKTKIEGVVMCPLKRPGFGFHGVKLLSEAFNDVRNQGKQNKAQKPNYATKARYHSVISKLDLHERADADMVAQMYIADILKESGEESMSNNRTKALTKVVRGWLTKDGCLAQATGGGDSNNKNTNRGNQEGQGQQEAEVPRGGAQNEAKTSNEDDDEEGGMGLGLFD